MAPFALALAAAAYCLAYAWLAGRPEPVGEALAWASINVIPWFLAFEAAKRAATTKRRIAALAAGFAVAVGLGSLSGDMSERAGFEAVRHLPVLLLVATLAWVTRRLAGEAGPCGPCDDIALPLPPAEIERVEAAGNYVEIRRRGGRPLVHRASLRAVERELAIHGFVRIHRSHLVRRDAIARIRPADVILRDGTSLKTGKRFRSALRG